MEDYIDETKLDIIDKEFLAKLRLLPRGGSIFDEENKIDMSALLLMFKAGFTHIREREIDNYYVSLKKRQFALSPGNLNIDSDYAHIIKDMFQKDKEQQLKTLKLACYVFN